MKQLKYDWWFSLGIIVNCFFFFFMILAIFSSKSPFAIYQIIDFGFENIWSKLMNIAIWYVLLNNFIKWFFEDIEYFRREDE